MLYLNIALLPGFCCCCCCCYTRFADLAGFTRWSSQREPDQVFALLETLYQAFDDIALRRKVFKVETMYVSLHALATFVDYSNDLRLPCFYLSAYIQWRLLHGCLWM